MTKFRDYLVEKSEYKVYFIDSTLWVAYGDGSGTTTEIRDFKNYITSKKDDKSYDDIVSKFEKFANAETPLKKKGNAKLFAVSSYKMADLKMNYGSKLDIWGGTIKPFKTVYSVLVPEQDYVIINFFEKKNDALNWLSNTNN